MFQSRIRELEKFLKDSTEMKELAEISLIDRLRELMENEARSCSMDFGCVTPHYVYRCWGGAVALEEIEAGLAELRKTGFMVG